MRSNSQPFKRGTIKLYDEKQWPFIVETLPVINPVNPAS
ncbi:unknow [Vibrio parahaemolyticus]|nr:unknow [Vibrio parahaemolyticus]